MCIAIPFGKSEKNNESALWRTIRSNPLYLLSTGALIQMLLLAIFWLALSVGLFSSNSLVSDPQLISIYSVLFGSTGFIYFAFTMHSYPRVMQTGTIEYLYFGGYFFLATYNLLFFYLASFLAHGLVITSIIIQIVLFLFAFQPVRRAYFWSNTHHSLLAYLVNSFFLLLLASQIVFLFLI